VRLCPPTFLLNVTLDSGRRLTGVFAGELEPAHDAAIAHAARQYRVEVAQPYDVVVVTNMGHPADTTLYQSVKGISAAAPAVREGGAILLVAGCEEGVGSPEFVSFLAEGASPAGLLHEIESATQPRHDQWQIQVQVMVQARAEVYVYSRLDRGQVEAAHLGYVADPSLAVRALVARARSGGRQGSVLVMPNGQLTVPVVTGA
jgi:nickel-dependent lactate racemase